MRALHLSDTHLGIDRWYRGAPPGWRRADDHLAAMRAALAPCFAGEVGLVLHTGDLFDRSRPPARAVAEAVALLTEAARHAPVLVMAGNHDRRGLQGSLGAIPGVVVVDRPTFVAIAGLRLAVVPFLAEPAAWRAAAAEVSAGGVDALLAHQAFDGSRVPGFTFRPAAGRDTVAATDLPRGVHTILNGHIHTRQSLRLGEAMVHHVGSTERTAFVERHERKGAGLWDLHARSVTPLDLPSRPMCVVEAPDELDHIEPASLVALGRALQTEAMAAEVAARGGWLLPWPAPTRQLALFGAGS